MASIHGRAARAEAAAKAHAPAVLAYFARRVDPPHHAADLLAETLLIVWRRAFHCPPSTRRSDLGCSVWHEMS